MTLARAMPFLILVLLVLGITVGFLHSDGGSPTETPPGTPPGAHPEAHPAKRLGDRAQAGLLVGLGPILRPFVGSERPQVDASFVVRAALDEWQQDPRPPILAALSDPDWGARWAGAIAVERYGASDAALLAALVPLLDDEHVLVRTAAARAGGFLGGEQFEGLLPHLVRAFRAADPLVREAALATVARRAARSPELIPQFTQALGDEVAGCRAQAARALAQIELQEHVGTASLQPVREALVTALADERNEVRIYAVMALGRAGPAAGPDVPALLPLLGDPDPLVRGQVATALGSIGPAALPALEARLSQETGPGAPALLWALRLMGAPALPLLRQTLAHPRAMVRMLVAQQLWEIKEDVQGALAVLRRGLELEDRAVRLVAIRVLGRMGTEGAEALPALERLASDQDAAVALAATAAAERLRSTQAPR